MFSAKILVIGIGRSGRRIGIGRRIESVRFDQNFLLGQIGDDQTVIVVAALETVETRSHDCRR